MWRVHQSNNFLCFLLSALSANKNAASYRLVKSYFLCKSLRKSENSSFTSSYFTLGFFSDLGASAINATEVSG